jgi:hypothetical protein
MFWNVFEVANIFPVAALVSSLFSLSIAVFPSPSSSSFSSVSSWREQSPWPLRLKVWFIWACQEKEWDRRDLQLLGDCSQNEFPSADYPFSVLLLYSYVELSCSSAVLLNNFVFYSVTLLHSVVSASVISALWFCVGRHVSFAAIIVKFHICTHISWCVEREQVVTSRKDKIGKIPV